MAKIFFSFKYAGETSTNHDVPEKPCLNIAEVNAGHSFLAPCSIPSRCIHMAHGSKLVDYLDDQ